MSARIPFPSKSNENNQKLAGFSLTFESTSQIFFRVSSNGALVYIYKLYVSFLDKDIIELIHRSRLVILFGET